MSPSILLVALLSGQTVDPCQDASYLELRGKTLSVMTDTERTYYLEKDRFCREAIQVTRGVAPGIPGSPAPDSSAVRTSAKAATKAAPTSNHRPVREASAVGLGAIGGFMAGLAALILVIRIVTL